MMYCWASPCLLPVLPESCVWHYKSVIEDFLKYADSSAESKQEVQEDLQHYLNYLDGLKYEAACFENG